MLQCRTRNLSFFASGTCNLLLSAGFSVSDLLSNFKGCGSTAIRTLDNSVAALFEDVLVKVFIGEGFALALVVGAIEGGAIEHSLLDRVQLFNVLNRFLAVFAVRHLCVDLTRSTDKFVTLAAISCLDCSELAIGTEGGLGEHGVGSTIE